HETYLLRKKTDGLSAGGGDDAFSVSANTIKHRWVMKDIPAFYVENYLSSPENYRDKIDFQLSQTYDGQDIHEVKNTWKKVTEDMLKDKDFASFITEEENNWWLDKHLDGILKNNTDQLAQAKEIYYYLSNNFTCTNYHSKYIKTSLQDVYKSQKGTVGEINLLLTDMLLRKHIRATPVVLSTRQFGYNYASYPILHRLDYVICKAIIDEKVYYLDASRPYLGFGHLPPDCYNGHARVIGKEDSASVYFMADSIKEWQTTFVSIINDAQGKGNLQGSYENSPGYMGSYALRESIGGSGQKKYFDGLQAAAGGEMEITATGIDSLKKPEETVKIRADFNITSMAANDIIYFNPVIWGDFKANPFHAADRKYPVEMPYPVNQVYVLNMETPAGFVIDEIPKSAKVSFNEGQGYFEYLVQKSEAGIQVRITVNMKKANFDPEEYNSLREFFGYIVKKQSEQVVFKRKK
ncbi:MAG TPA: transglutaminase-like domain-containing protein, partial [Chitinophagaceae bacterium]|nr:transglutaminase-like domain-containing protein [Chitinophagaceae bacterium]